MAADDLSGERQPTFNDVRDDFDDEFGRSLTPREAARRAMVVPAIGMIVVGVIGVIGMLIVGAVVLVDCLQEALEDDVVAIDLVSAEIAVALGIGLFGFVILGGVSMLQLRRRWVALYSAYVVAGLSLAGLYAILLYPFGFWGLIVLYRPDVWREFQRRPRKVRTDD